MMILPEFDLVRPITVAEAIAAARDCAGAFDYLGGGTDILQNYKCGVNVNRTMISLRHISELRGRDGGSIGAGVTLAALERDEDFLHAFPVFAQTLRQLASPLIRQTGTVGGNLLCDTRCIFLNQTEFARKALGYCLKADGPECRVVKGAQTCYANYSGDMAPVFMVLGADVRLAGPDGERTLALEDFFQLDGIQRTVKQREEIVVSIELPSDAHELRAGYEKLRLRDAFDYPELAVAAAGRMDGDRVTDLRLVANAVASIPLWLDEIAAKYDGSVLDDATLDAIAADMVRAVKPVRATLLPPSYRKQMVGVMTKRALRTVRGAAIPVAAG